MSINLPMGLLFPTINREQPTLEGEPRPAFGETGFENWLEALTQALPVAAAGDEPQPSVTTLFHGGAKLVAEGAEQVPVEAVDRPATRQPSPFRHDSSVGEVLQQSGNKPQSGMERLPVGLPQEPVDRPENGQLKSAEPVVPAENGNRLRIPTDPLPFAPAEESSAPQAMPAPTKPSPIGTAPLEVEHAIKNEEGMARSLPPSIPAAPASPVEQPPLSATITEPEIDVRPDVVRQAVRPIADRKSVEQPRPDMPQRPTIPQERPVITTPVERQQVATATPAPPEIFMPEQAPAVEQSVTLPGKVDRPQSRPQPQLQPQPASPAPRGESAPPVAVIETEMRPREFSRPERFRTIRTILAERATAEPLSNPERSPAPPQPLRPIAPTEQAVKQFYKSEMILEFEQPAVRAETVSKAPVAVHSAPRPQVPGKTTVEQVVRPVTSAPSQPAAMTIPAAELPEPATAPLLKHEAVAQAILARAQTMQKPGVIEMRFALAPAELGTVRIRLEARGEQLRVELVASTQSAVETLNAGLSRLAANLSTNGFPQAEVTLGLATSTPSGAQAQTNMGDGGSGSTHNQQHSSGAARDGKPADEPATGRQPSRHRLDRTA